MGTQVDHYTCCHCNEGLVPLDGNIANGCELPSCGFADHDGHNFTCGVDRYLQNLNATQLDHVTCCHCNEGLVPLDGNLANGCTDSTRSHVKIWLSVAALCFGLWVHKG